MEVAISIRTRRGVACFARRADDLISVLTVDADDVVIVSERGLDIVQDITRQRDDIPHPSGKDIPMTPAPGGQTPPDLKSLSVEVALHLDGLSVMDAIYVLRLAEDLVKMTTTVSHRALVPPSVQGEGTS